MSPSAEGPTPPSDRAAAASRSGAGESDGDTGTAPGGEPDGDAESVRHYRPPRQERSRKTLERLEAAALGLVEEEGVDGLTVQAVVDRADSSVGSFYARFRGKDELLLHLEERVWTEAAERWDGARADGGWSALGPEEVVRAAVALLVRTAREDASRREAFRSSRSAEGSGHAASFHRHVLDDLAELIDPGGRGPGWTRTVELGYWMVVGALRLLHAPGSPAGTPPPDSELAGELASAYLAYLGLGRPGPVTGSEPEPDFFDVWG